MCLALVVSACKDEPQAAAEAQKQPSVAETATAVEPVAEQPNAAAVRAQLLPMLAGFPAIKLGEVQADVSVAEDGDSIIVARAQTLVEENLYTQESAPEMLHEERKAANDAINRAMLPEASYLLQAGAGTEDIAEEDRSAKPLPENLQAAADELRRMAEASVYHLHTTAGTVIEIAATLRAHPQGDQWEFTEMNCDMAPLSMLIGKLAEGSLPEGAVLMRDGSEQELRLAMREKVAAFNEAAKPYISGREEATRKRMLENRTRREEAQRAAEEKAAADAACHELWEKACAERLKEGMVYTGEWKRGEAFGKLALRMSTVQRYPDSLQFVGLLYNPDMPQAEIQIVGRCEAPSCADGPIPLTVHLYNGRYDPDIATAEVYDSKDGILRLKVDAATGTMAGEMTCEAWADAPDKAFAVSLAPAPQKPARRR